MYNWCILIRKEGIFIKNLIPLIGGWVKSHVITTVVVSTVVVGGAIATPIVISNFDDNQVLSEEKAPIKEKVETPEENKEEEKQEENKTTEEKEEKKPIKETTKPVTKPTESTKNPVNNNNNKPSEKPETSLEQVKGFNIKNNIIYKDGKELIKIETYDAQKYVDVIYGIPKFNEADLKALSENEKQDLVNNYMCKAFPGGCSYSVDLGTVPSSYYGVVGIVRYPDQLGWEPEYRALEYEASIAKKCIQYFTDGSFPDEEITPPNSDPFKFVASEYCTADRKGINAWKRQLEYSEDNIKRMKHDEPIIKRMVPQIDKMLDILVGR